MMLSQINNLKTYRQFIMGSVKRDFQLRYTSSILGALWTIIGPISMILMYTFVFSHLMPVKLGDSQGSLAYSFYLCAGILSWNLFLELTSRFQVMFFENATIIKKLSFPFICIPIIIIISSLINYCIVFILLLSFLTFSGHFPNPYVLWAIPITGILIFFSASIGVLLGVTNVFFRDVGHFFSVLTSFWFWLTPIVYVPTVLPVPMRSIIQLNPLTPIVTSMQNVLVFNKPPDFVAIFYVFVLSAFLFFLAVRILKRQMSEVIDKL